ncbi:hypothetical protein QQM39_18995 [Streptomyces sp. DT2A-34]|uniref:hypothetical protein n=1 Tax=Streptomyces sp. DT2A-34 TaxID=3051182 RepID=UPI00265BCB83|nr:hypothetical protein [Streptomyces sp. DT2A-34]MDO0912853.1 hypothetical protein [Streptomyces sp. DT2A-34]
MAHPSSSRLPVGAATAACPGRAEKALNVGETVHLQTTSKRAPDRYFAPWVTWESHTRLRELAQSGDYACYVEIVHFIAGLPLPEHIARARWIDGEQQTRERRRNLVETRRNRLGAAR